MIIHIYCMYIWKYSTSLNKTIKKERKENPKNKLMMYYISKVHFIKVKWKEKQNKIIL